MRIFSTLFRASILSLVVFFLFSISNIKAADYYVSTSGSDSNAGTLASPWRTIQKAVNTVKAGDKVLIRGGTYQEQLWIGTSGTQSSPVTYTNCNGEEVIIDGNNFTNPSKGGGTPLVGLTGDWINFSNITLRYSGGIGLYSGGSHNTMDNLYIYNNWEGGAILSGNYNLIQNSRMWHNSLVNENNQSPTGWGSGVSCARYPDYCTIRNCTVWDNWGEGISTFESLHATLEDNVSYNNQQNFYISDTKYSVLQRNLSYCTPGNPIDTYQTQNGILIGDEKGVPIPLGSGGTRYTSSDNTIINNMVIGCNRNLAAGQSTNNLYAYNTFVNSAGSTDEPFNILFYAGSATNQRFVNNLIIQEDDRVIGYNGGGGEMAFSHNFWSKTPNSNFSGTGDVNLNGDKTQIANLLTRTNGQLTSGGMTTSWFKLTSSSPAIGKAVALSEVTTDLFKNNRDSAPDIGANEYQGSLASTATPTVAPTMTVTPTPTPIIKLGDANSDNLVDERDYVIWLAQYSLSKLQTGGVSLGDFNSDNKINGIDYVIWLNNYGK